MKLMITYLLLIITLFIISCQGEDQIEYNRYYSSGSLVFQNHCENCHGKKGEGLLALIPSLDDSLYLKTHKKQLACYVKMGLKGQITIQGKHFDNQMPPQDLSPIELAEVLTYIGNSFGNKLNIINEQQVEADLAKCK